MSIPEGKFALPGHAGGSRIYEALRGAELVEHHDVRVFYRFRNGGDDTVEGAISMVIGSPYGDLYLSLTETRPGKGPRPRNLHFEGIIGLVDLFDGESYTDVRDYLRAKGMEIPA